MSNISVLLLILVLAGCARGHSSVSRDEDSETKVHDECVKICKKEYGTSLIHVGVITGDCYCE